MSAACFPVVTRPAVCAMCGMLASVLGAGAVACCRRCHPHDAGVDLDRERGQAVTDSCPCRASAAVLKVLEALSHGGSEQLHVVGDAL